MHSVVNTHQLDVLLRIDCQSYPAVIPRLLDIVVVVIAKLCVVAAAAGALLRANWTLGLCTLIFAVAVTFIIQLC